LEGRCILWLLKTKTIRIHIRVGIEIKIEVEIEVEIENEIIHTQAHASTTSDHGGGWRGVVSSG